MHKGRALLEFCAQCGGACEFTVNGNRRSNATVQRANDTMVKAHGTDFDLHVWGKPGNESRSALYTVNVGQQVLCVDVPLAEALNRVRWQLEEAVESL